MSDDDDIVPRVEQIAAKVQAVARGDYHPFGVEGHGLRLNPPLTESQVSTFEHRHRIELPSEYRSFITCVADGGAGPAYGMFSLQEALTKERGGRVPDDFLRTPFPHTQAYNPYDDPRVQSLWQCVESGETSPPDGDWQEGYQTTGTLDLCHEGCGYLHFLVVTGPARGQMWLDAWCSDGGFLPLGVGFLDWYERWLDSTLAGGDGVWWMSDSEE